MNQRHLLMRTAMMMLLAMFTTIEVGAQTTSTYRYSFCTWDSKKNTVTKSPALATAYDLTSKTNVQNSTFTNEGGKWGVSGNVVHTGRLFVHHDTQLILANGATLTAQQGIYIKEGVTLTIYANSDVETEMGKILAYGEGSDWAAIGGNKNAKAGKLIIHGGNITAEAKHNNAAGIGGGNGEDSGMEAITIYSGKITAKGKSSGAGIGGGQHNDKWGTITIYSGTIDATGGRYGAGIGGGEDRGGWDTNIYNGTVTAQGGEYGAGIGGGIEGDGGNLHFFGGTVTATGGGSAAGIGGGEGGNGGNIIIDGGNITATGGKGMTLASDWGYGDLSEGAGIGGGSGGEGGTITINDGDIEAYGAGNLFSAAGIGGGAFARGGKVTINGGTIYARGGEGANWDCGSPGIGSGYAGGRFDITINGGSLELKSGTGAATIGYKQGLYSNRLTLNPNMAVTISQKKIKIERDKRKDYLTRCMLYNENTGELKEGRETYYFAFSTIKACKHPAADFTYTLSDDNSKHVAQCKYCSYTKEPEAHDAQTNTPCSKCGYESQVYTITSIMPNHAGTDYEGVGTNVVAGSDYYLPECTKEVTDMEFVGWLVGGDMPATFETNDEEVASLKAPGDKLTVNSSVNVYARYRYKYTEAWGWTPDHANATLHVKLESASGPGQLISGVTVSTEDSKEPTASTVGYVSRTATATYKPNGYTYTFTDTWSEPLYYALSLTEEDNTDAIDASAGNMVTATLTGRTLFKDGAWNTLCLPFDVKDGDDTDVLTFTGTPLVGATVMELSDASIDNGTLTLNFSEAIKIKAGHPYLIKWDKPSGYDGHESDYDLSPSNLVFSGVTINTDASTEVTFEDIKFVGTYAPFEITAENKDNILYIGSANKIGHSKNARTLRSFRAHFELTNPAAAPVRTVVVDYGEEEIATEIISMEDGRSQMEDDSWYTLSGIRLDGKPTEKGIYLFNGKKVVIK